MSPYLVVKVLGGAPGWLARNAERPVLSPRVESAEIERDVRSERRGALVGALGALSCGKVEDACEAAEDEIDDY